MSRPNGQCSAGKYREDYEDGTFSGCGRYLTAGDFEIHRVQRDGVDGYSRRCMTDTELLAKGWVDNGDGSWSSPRRILQAQQVAARMGGPSSSQHGTGAPAGGSRPSREESPATTGAPA